MSGNRVHTGLPGWLTREMLLLLVRQCRLDKYALAQELVSRMDDDFVMIDQRAREEEQPEGIMELIEIAHVTDPEDKMTCTDSSKKE